jgi:hypothetical protein
MKKLLAATAVTALMTTGAYAATFSGSFAISGDAFSDPGLVVSANPTSGTGTFNIANVGESITFALFDIWTAEGTVNSDDLIPQSINVDFDMTSPEANGTLGGSSVGESMFFGLFQGGSVSWGSPLSLLFGNGGQLDLALNDADFNWGLFGTTPGQKHGATINLTATYVSESIAPVPLPATGLLLIAGLGGLAVARRRKKAA